MPDLADRAKRERETEMAVWLLFQQQYESLSSNPAAAPWSVWRDQTADVLVDPLTATYMQAYRALAAEKGIDKTDQEVLELAAAWAVLHAQQVASGIVTNSQEMSRQAIARAAQSGEELATALEGTFARSRAEAIGITETTTAKSAAEQALMSERNRRLAVEVLVSGEEPKVEVPFWITERDARVCPICAPLHGKPEWDWPLEQRDGPPAHPRCRCDKQYKLTPVRKIPEPMGAV